MHRASGLCTHKKCTSSNVRPSRSGIPVFNFSLKFVLQTSDAWRALKPPEDRYQATRASNDDLEEGETVGVVDRADTRSHNLNGLEAKDEVIGCSNEI